MNRRILLCLNHMGGTEIKYVERAFADNWVVPLGPDVDAFEEVLTKRLQPPSPLKGEPLSESQHGNSPFRGLGGWEGGLLALSSGTAAVHLALEGCGVKAGDEVIVQSMTFCASSNPIFYLGAKPVLVDSEAETWNMDPRLLDLAISTRIAATGRKPRAIVVADLYGMPAKWDEIHAVAERYGIPVIEDAAEALGSEYRGEPCGTLGRYGVLSFNGNKMITTSGGGALVCPDEEARKHALFLATQAREPYPYYQHEHIGYNYRLSNISAAIGRGQMEALERHLAHHRLMAKIYQEEFADHPLITFHGNPNADFDSNFWLNTILISPEAHVEGQETAYDKIGTTDCQPNANVEAIRQRLAAEGVETRPLWKPLHRQPVYRGCAAYINGTSESLFARGLCLPSGPYVTEDDARSIAATIKNLMKNEK
ncbi:MAG: DegT/DnrJ/EryC1/StrS family aminotransferase [Bacteroidales bacterium]|nr:DegT/DnrJ/EryC1/StrS family aminotransferase [Bacteroidales bacterium]